MKRIRTADNGQTVVEFALMLPFFLFMLLFLVEFGYAFYTQILVRNSASEAARYAAVGALPSAACAADSIQDRVIDASGGLVSCGGADTITVTYQDAVLGEYTRSSGVAVRIDYEYTPITPLGAVASLISWGTVPATWDLSACADSRLETRPSDQGALVAGADCS